jgi:hypothetical protein
LLTFALIAAGVSLVAAVLALFRAGRAGKRAERLAESYWDLRYEIGQLKVRIDRLEAVDGVDGVGRDHEAAAQRPAPTTSFVPLSSLKK